MSLGSKPHICLVSNTSWSIIKFRNLLVQELVLKGYMVTVVAPEDDYTEKIVKLGVNFVPLQHLASKGTNPLADMRLQREFEQIFSRLKPDIIFCYTIKPNIYGTLAAKKVGIPSISVITGLGFTFINKGLVPYLARQLYRYALRFPRQVWFLNNADLELFVSKKLVSKDKAQLLPSEGIDTKRFTPMVHNSSNQIRFLVIARLLFSKGIREFVEAARIVRREHPNTVFSILGYLGADNPEAIDEQQMNAWTDEGIVEYLGSASDVRPYIAEADCVVLPSYREGISVTLMEGAAMGKPLIATDIPGCSELIEHGVTGLLCSVKSAQSLAEQFQSFINLTPEQRKLMGEKSRNKIVSQYSFENIFPFYERTIKKYVN